MAENNNPTYTEVKNKEYVLKLREVLARLPRFMKTYIYGIEQKTQPRTRIAYLGDNEVFFRFIKQVNPVYKNMEIVDFPLKMLDQITTEDIEEYEHYLKYYIDPETHCEIINNERAIKRKMSSLRSMYNFFYKNQSIDTNPAMQIDMPKLHDKAIVRMDTEEVSRLLDVVETGETLSDAQKRFHNKNKLRDLTMISLLLGTGIRVSECVGLDIGDVDFKNCGIKIVRKGGYESIVYFSDEIKRQLEMYLKERNAISGIVEGHENALFLSDRKRRMGVRTVEIMVKKYTSTVTSTKKITPHKLRSTYGTNLYRKTGDIYLVADVLGHKDVNTTKKHYAAIDEDRRRQARNIVSLHSESSSNYTSDSNYNSNSDSSSDSNSDSNSD